MITRVTVSVLIWLVGAMLPCGVAWLAGEPWPWELEGSSALAVSVVSSFIYFVIVVVSVATCPLWEDRKP